MLQEMLVTHGVGLEVAAFSGHHVTPQGEEAGFEVLSPERDLKRQSCLSWRLHQGFWQAHQARAQGDMSVWLVDTFSFPLHTKILIGSGSAKPLLALLHTFAEPGTRDEMEADLSRDSNMKGLEK